MANQKHLHILWQDVEEWNRWREDQPEVRPNLRGADLSDANFSIVDFSDADLSSANLTGTDLSDADLTRANLVDARLAGATLAETDFTRAILANADLTGADLTEAILTWADLTGADLSGTRLVGADLSGADLTRTNLASSDLTGVSLEGADLTKANLSSANLTRAYVGHSQLVNTDLRGANLTECYVYGVSAWDLLLDEHTTQNSLVITGLGAPKVSVDNIEVAHFLYLLLTGPKLRNVIDTISTKAVLILGRFTEERKAVLDAIRDALRQHGYVPILFDFEKPENRDFTETVSTLAHLARFIIADITDAKSIPQELQRIVPGLPSVPVQPLLLESQREYGMFEHFRRYPWVLEPYLYQDQIELLANLLDAVIMPAEAKASELAPRLRLR